MAPMEVVTVLTLAALGWKLTSFAKLLSAKDWNGALTTVIPWASMLVVLLLASQEDHLAGITVWGEINLGTLSFSGLVLAAMSLGSSGSVGYDIKSALDGSDSAKEPELGGTKE